MNESVPPRRRRRAFDWSTATIAAVALAAAITVFVRDGEAQFLTILGGDLDLLVDMTPKVLAGCLIAVFITLLLPREAVARWVGAESGFPGLIVASVVGFILPGGAITIFPVASAIMAMGADGGAIVAFLTSWTLVGYTRALVWEMPFFGVHFVLWRMLVATPLPILVGIVARIVVRALRLKLEGKT